MEPAEYDMKVHQGDTFMETFTLSNDDVTLLSLTGFSALMKWRERATGTIKVTCDSAATPSTMTITVGATNSVITPIITAAQTALLSPGGYDYELQLTSPGGIVQTAVKGSVEVGADVVIA